jgi:hypothetical protein
LSFGIRIAQDDIRNGKIGWLERALPPEVEEEDDGMAVEAGTTDAPGNSGTERPGL